MNLNLSIVVNNINLANQKICQISTLPILIRKDGLGLIRDTAYLNVTELKESASPSNLFVFITDNTIERRAGITNDKGIILCYADFHDAFFLNENYLALQYYTDFGLINLQTYERTPIIFSSINMEIANLHSTNNFGDNKPIAIVSIQGRYGVINKRLKPIVPLEFDSISYHETYGIIFTKNGWQASTAITNIHNYNNLKFRKINPRSYNVNIGFTSDDAEELDYIRKNGGDWIDDN